jgi:hypothetical protein
MPTAEVERAVISTILSFTVAQSRFIDLESYDLPVDGSSSLPIWSLHTQEPTSRVGFDQFDVFSVSPPFTRFRR